MPVLAILGYTVNWRPAWATHDCLKGGGLGSNAEVPQSDLLSPAVPSCGSFTVIHKPMPLTQLKLVFDSAHCVVSSVDFDKAVACLPPQHRTDLPLPRESNPRANPRTGLPEPVSGYGHHQDSLVGEENPAQRS